MLRRIKLFRNLDHMVDVFAGESGDDEVLRPIFQSYLGIALAGCSVRQGVAVREIDSLVDAHLT